MAMTFEESLQEVCKKIALSAEDRQRFTRDAEIIRNELMSRMQERSEFFKNAYNGLSLTGSYLDRLKIDLPNEFDLHIKLKMDFPIKPIADQNRPGFVKLTAPKDTNNMILSGLRQRCINRFLLQNLIRKAFLKVIGYDGITMVVDGSQYAITYPKYGRGAGVAHTIVAQQVNGKREISFDFVPAFEFQPSEWPMKSLDLDTKDLSWFAVPFGKKLHGKKRSNSFAFMACAPHWERIVLHNKKNLKNSLRLMKALRDTNQLNRLSSYMLKSIYLQEIESENHSDSFWESPMGEILIEMLEVLAKDLKKGCLPFFLHNGFNHLDLLPKKLIEKYQNKLQDTLKKLHYFQECSRVNYVDVAKLFVPV